MGWTRTCTKCKKPKSLEEFPKDKTRKDGRQYICRNCSKIKYDTWANSEAGKTFINEYEQSQPRKTSMRINLAKYVEKNPEKILAQRAVHYAVKTKKLHKPDNCSRCNEFNERIEGHHPDYSKPLEVVWLCKQCHVKEHSKVRSILLVG